MAIDILIVMTNDTMQHTLFVTDSLSSALQRFSDLRAQTVIAAIPAKAQIM